MPRGRDVPRALAVRVVHYGYQSVCLTAFCKTAFVWTGIQVELMFTFKSPQVLNRVSISLPANQGISVVEFTSSPHGVSKENLLAGLPAANLSIGGSAGKYSGDWIADFGPRSVQQLRIVLADFVGSPNITISAEQHSAVALTSISHQLSTDGVHYTGIVPGQPIAVGSGGFWYRANMRRRRCPRHNLERSERWVEGRCFRGHVVFRRHRPDLPPGPPQALRHL